MKVSALLVVSALATGLVGVCTASAAPASGTAISTSASVDSLAQNVWYHPWGWRGWGWRGGVGAPGAGVHGAQLTIGRGGDLAGATTTPTDVDGSDESPEATSG
jgi:hypothetical protein